VMVEQKAYIVLLLYFLKLCDIIRASLVELDQPFF